MGDKINITGSDNLREVNPAWFTGRVWMKTLSDRIGSPKQDMYHVHFESGSKTKLHQHNGSQILIVTQGRGSLDVFRADGPVKNSCGIHIQKSTRLYAGDMVFIPENTLHAHGSADPSQRFSHIAINNLPCGTGEYVTEWYESTPNTIVKRI